VCEKTWNRLHLPRKSHSVLAAHVIFAPARICFCVYVGVCVGGWVGVEVRKKTWNRISRANHIVLEHITLAPAGVCVCMCMCVCEWVELRGQHEIAFISRAIHILCRRQTSHLHLQGCVFVYLYVCEWVGGWVFRCVEKHRIAFISRANHTWGGDGQ